MILLKTLRLASVLAVSVAAQTPDLSLAESLLRSDQLPRFRPFSKVGSFSSYDRKGGNDDGFQGTYSFLRKEGDGLVIAELRGPGALTRIWTPTPTADPVEFFFDDETSPRLRVPFVELFNGKTKPFVAPLSGYGAGGYYTYVPLTFAKSIKVVMRAPRLQFYQINYVQYEPSTAVRTFQPSDSPGLPAVDLAGRTVRGQHVLNPGKPVTVFETRNPGRIVSLKLGPSEALAGDDRSIVVRIYWDGAERPAVEAPAGDLFGYSFGQPATRSLLVGTDDDGNYLRFPMPFDRSARIEMISERVGAKPITIQSEVVVSDRRKEAGEGLFHAVWRRENPTTPGSPFTFLDVQGRGHVVGNILQAQGAVAGQTAFFEGDDEATIDGELSIRGTGSEDFFNGGWYDLPGRWNGRVSLPFSGSLEYRKHLARTGGYRLFLADAYSFRRSLLLTIEHGPEKNAIATDYTGLTYFYLDRPGGTAPPISNVAARKVHQPETFVVSFAGTPVHAFSSNATLSTANARVDNRNVRFLSFRQTGRPNAIIRSDPFVAVSIDAPFAGDYAISLEGVTGPENGIAQILIRDQPFGESVDLYSPEQGVTGVRKLGVLRLENGINHLFVAATGQNPSAKGKGLDLVRLHCARVQ